MGLIETAFLSEETRPSSVAERLSAEVEKIALTPNTRQEDHEVKKKRTVGVNLKGGRDCRREKGSEGRKTRH